MSDADPDVVDRSRAFCLARSEASIGGWFGALGLIGGLSGICEGWARAATIVVALSGMALLAVMVIVRSRARQADRSAADAATEQAIKDRWQLLDRDLSPLLILLAEAVGTRDHAERAALAAKVRKGVTRAATVIVAPHVEDGIRANLFRRDGQKMCLEPGCFDGRGQRSNRTIKPREDTWKACSRGEFQLVENAEGRGYDTYLTSPITSGVTDDKLLGVLTVDAPHTGDLTQRDEAAVTVLAAIAAAAYECERVLPAPPGE